MSAQPTMTGPAFALVGMQTLAPRGATLTILVRDHRRTRSGTSATTMQVLIAMDGGIGDVTGWAATLSGNAASRSDDHGSESGPRVTVLGYGDPKAAARELIRSVAQTVYNDPSAYVFSLLH